MKISNGSVSIDFNKSGISISKIDNNGHSAFTDAPLTPKDWSKLRKWIKKNKKSLTTEIKVKAEKVKVEKATKPEKVKKVKKPSKAMKSANSIKADLKAVGATSTEKPQTPTVQ